MFGAWTNSPDVPKDGEPKATPPEATPIILPRPLILKPARVTYYGVDSLIVEHIRFTFRSAKLRHLGQEDFRKLNISSADILPLEELLPSDYIPPKSWLISLPQPRDLPNESTALAYEVLLSNGVKRPSHRKFLDFSKELLTDLRTVYRSLRRDPAPQGEQNLRVLQFRKFWIALHNVGRFWDDSLDDSRVVDRDTTEKYASTAIASMPSQTNASGQEAQPDSGYNSKIILPGNGDLDEEISEADTEEAPESSGPSLTYTGRRTSTGSQMDSLLSMKLAEAFLEPLMFAFGCHFDQTSRGIHDLYLVKTVASCLNTKLIYTKPKDPLLARQGILEGPIAVIQAHASVAFGPDTNGEVEQFIRELKAILLCAQQRSREHELPFFPGAGEWWGLSSGKWGHTVSNGTGKLPGEAMGEALTDLDLFPDSSVPFTAMEARPASVLTPAQNHLQDSAMTDAFEDGGSSDNAATSLDLLQPESSENQAKILPLTGEDLMSRIMESTLATPLLDSVNLKDANCSSTNIVPASKMLSEQAIGISKKRSFDAFTTPSNTLQLVGGNGQGTIEVDAETSIPTQAAISHKSTSQTLHNLRYKLMLEGVRQGMVSEQKMRRTFTERSNQPARELFSETFKKSKRIGMSPTANRDDIYLISVLNHHISFIHSSIDHKLIDWLSPNPRERSRVTSLKKDTSSWWGIPLRRSRWYNLFDEQDRVEALRATWTIFGKMMADPENDLKAAMAARDHKYGATASVT